MLTNDKLPILICLFGTATGIDMATNFIKLPLPVQQSVAQHVATLVELMQIMEKSHGYSKRN